MGDYVHTLRAQLRYVQLIEDRTITSGNSFTTGTLDIRQQSIVSVIARGLAASSQPNYKVEWAGGITTTEIMGDSQGAQAVDRFEPFVDDIVVPSYTEPPLLSTMLGGTHPLGSEQWIAAPFPHPNTWPPTFPLWPFVRFRLTPEVGSPSAVYNLFAVLQPWS